MTANIATDQIDENKYKTVDEAHVFILNLIVFFNSVGFVFSLLSASYFIIFYSIFLSISLYIKKIYDFKHHPLIVSLFHANIFLMSLFYTYSFGWDSGFWLFLIGLVFLNYFCGFQNKFINYFLAIFEISLVIFLYYLFSSKGSTLENSVLKITYVCCFILNYLIIFRFCIFANILTSNRYLNLKEEQRQLEHISKYDQLTGLLNRRSMEQIIKLKARVATGEKEQINKVVMLGDIDDFKKINDSFGHAYGDIVLKDVASVLKNTFRKDDYVCRWGGEEFLVILPNTDIEFIYHLSERLLRNISNIRLPNANPVTMTFGMVICTGDIDLNTKDIIEKADKLLYNGKTNGKDRIEMEILK